MKKLLLTLVVMTLLTSCSPSAYENDIDTMNDANRIAHLQIMQSALVGAYVKGDPLPDQSGCITDVDEDGGVNFSQYIDELYGSVPADPKAFSKLNYANGVSCIGKYYYKKQPSKDHLFGLYAIVEDWDNANTTCKNGFKGRIDTSGKSAPCYAILQE